MPSLRPLLLLPVACLAVPACHPHEGHAHHEHHTIVATGPQVKDVTLTQQYVAQIHSQRHIKVRAIESGYLDAVPVREGQAVKKGDLLFKVVPVLYQAKLEAEQAEVRLAELKYRNTERLQATNVVSQQEVLLAQAELAKTQAKLKLAQAELDFATVRAPFDGIIDRLEEQQGSLVKEEAVLTTLSDNGTMWVYFNVPEARYLEYMATPRKEREDVHVELVLADGKKFPQAGKVGAVEADFNSETGNIPFRADFPNPAGLLRHGQTGTVLIHRVVKNAVVIPQRATFEILDKRYVYVVGADGVVRQREVSVANELEDVFVLRGGLSVGEKIVLEGVRQVHDGEKVECEFREPGAVIADQKRHAE